MDTQQNLPVVVPSQEKSKKKKARKTPRHFFYYEIVDRTTGKTRMVKEGVPVRAAKRRVDLILTAEHVRRSIKLKGVGDTSACSMAVCAQNHSDSFPHKVEGHIDWTYSRAFVISKVNKDGKPTECVCYEHSDEIAKLNDTVGGQKELLARIEKDGPIHIVLKPKRIRSETGRPGRDRKPTGARAYKPTGGNLRRAKAMASTSGGSLTEK